MLLRRRVLLLHCRLPTPTHLRSFEIAREDLQELSQSLGWGFEASLGYRRLQFSSGTDVYVGALTKYLGDWMLTGRVSHVPESDGNDSTSYYAIVRRYFEALRRGADGK